MGYYQDKNEVLMFYIFFTLLPNGFDNQNLHDIKLSVSDGC